MENKMKIRTSIKYNELKAYKKQFEKGEISQVDFKIDIDKSTFDATLKYVRRQVRFSYDREFKFMVFLEGRTKDKVKASNILDLYNELPSHPLLIAEILFMKIDQDMILKDNGEVEYKFTFLQY